MAYKRRIHEFFFSLLALVGVFSMAFFLPHFLSSSVFKADLLGGTSIQSVLASSIQCSTNERFQIPISGESGSYHVSVDQTQLGSFYVNNNNSSQRSEMDVTKNDTLWFVGNNQGFVGTANIMVKDNTTGSQELVPVQVGFPCVKTMRFCKDTSGGSCVAYTGNDLKMVQGRQFDIPYLELTFYGATKIVQKLPLSNVQLIDQAPEVDSSASGFKYASLLNSKTYASQSAQFSEPLYYTLGGVNCAYESNNIFSNTRAVTLPEDINVSQLPQKASNKWVFQSNQNFIVNGYSLTNTQYNFEFLPVIDQKEEAYEELADAGTVKSYRIKYFGNDIRSQMNSIIKTYAALPVNSAVLRIDIEEPNILVLSSNEIGLSKTYPTANTWKIGLKGQSLAPFSSSATVGTWPGFDYMEENLKSFPDTITQGDILMAYYPGTTGQALWSASSLSTTQDGKVIQLAPIQGVLTSEGTAGQNASTQNKCIITVSGEQYDVTSYLTTHTDTTLSKCGQDVTTEVLAKGETFITQTLLPYKITSTSESVQTEQYLSGYDYNFVMVKALQPGVAVINVNGTNCSQSKRITVVADEVELWAQKSGDTNSQPVSDGKLSLAVNELATLSAKLKNSASQVSESAITWEIIDNTGNGIVQLQKIAVGLNSDGSYQFASSSTVKALKQGSAVVRAKIARGTSDFIYSRPITISVASGLEVNTKGYDYTEEIYPGQSPKEFTVTAIKDSGTVPFSNLQWITDDVHYGSFIITGLFNEKLVYTAPKNDGNARLYIDMIRATDTKTNQSITVTLKIRPPKIVNQYITTVDAQTPIINQELTKLQENKFALPWMKILEITALPQGEEQLLLDQCVVSFDMTQGGSSDFDCSDGVASLKIGDTVDALLQRLSQLQIPDLGVQKKGLFVAFTKNSPWELKEMTGGDIKFSAYDGQAPLAQVSYFTPDTNKILVGNEVQLLLNGQKITTGKLVETNPDMRRSEIIQKLAAAAESFADIATFSAVDIDGALVSPSSANTKTLILTATNGGTPFTAFINSINFQNDIQLRLGRNINLKIVALLEDGSVAEWYEGQGQLNPKLFGNPTWSAEASDGVAKVVDGGKLFAEKVGAGPISVVLPTRWYEAAASVAQTTTTGSSSWVEKIENNPTVSAQITVLPAFKVNGLFRKNLNDPEDLLNITGKTAGETVFTVTDLLQGTTLIWTKLQDMSGINGTINGNNYSYKAGPKSDQNGGSIVDILRVFDGYTNFDIRITVNPATLESINLQRLNNDPGNPLAAIHVGETIPLSLIYKLTGSAVKQIDINDGATIPAELEALQWETSDEKIVKVSGGQAIALTEGVATISVSSSLNTALKASLILTVEGRKASFIANTTKITPSFPTVDALIHVETVVLDKDGIDNIQEVNIKFNSPYLPNGKLKVDTSYNQDLYGRLGVASSEVPAATLATSETRKEAKYILDYQLPGEKALEGKTVTYVLTITTKQGVRTSSEEISQVGTITIGSVQNLCTSQNKLMCLIRGLKCLKDKGFGASSEECDTVVSVFTSKPEQFSILDIIKKYKELRK